MHGLRNGGSLISLRFTEMGGKLTRIKKRDVIYSTHYVYQLLERFTAYGMTHVGWEEK